MSFDEENPAPAGSLALAARTHINQQRQELGLPPIPDRITDQAAADEYAASREAAQRQRQQPAQQGGPAQAPRKRFRFLTRSAMRDLPPTQYLVDNVLVEDGLNLVWGPYGSFKSFQVIDWCAHIATGRRWQGNSVKKKRVVYIAPEGANGINQRLEAWEKEHGVTVDEDYWITLPMSVSFVDGEAVHYFIRDLQALFEEMGVEPDGFVVVVDTFARCLAGGDENSSKDANTAIAKYEHVRDELGATFIIVHHSGKDASKGARGANALPSGMDTEFSMVVAGDGTVTLTNHKQKDRPKYPVQALLPMAVYGSVVMRTPNTNTQAYGQVAQVNPFIHAGETAGSLSQAMGGRPF